MISKEIAAIAITILAIFLLSLIARSKKYGIALLKKIKAPQVSVNIFSTIADAAATAVSAVQRDYVSAMKDPSRPGTWDEIAKETARKQAAEAIKKAVPEAIEKLAKEVAPKDMEAMIRGFIEEEVNKMKSKEEKGEK